MTAELYFPLSYAKEQFRRKPWPNVTYEEAIVRAKVLLWNMVRSSPERTDREAALQRGAVRVHRKLSIIRADFLEEHPDYPGRSRVLVKEFNDLWRGEVTTLLTMFRSIEESATK